jgi:hypothetical protein
MERFLRVRSDQNSGAGAEEKGHVRCDLAQDLAWKIEKASSRACLGSHRYHLLLGRYDELSGWMIEVERCVGHTDMMRYIFTSAGGGHLLEPHFVMCHQSFHSPQVLRLQLDLLFCSVSTTCLVQHSPAPCGPHWLEHVLDLQHRPHSCVTPRHPLPQIHPRMEMEMEIQAQIHLFR